MVVVATIAESMPGSLKLCYGESDMATPAFICDALDRAARDGHTFYTHTAGSPELRQSIAAKIHDLHHVPYEPSQIVATTGATMAIYAAIRALVGRGDNLVYISPAYALYSNAAIMSGAEARPVPLTLSGKRFVLDLDRVRAAIDGNTRLLVVNSPSNPTGWVISEPEQRALLELAERHDLVLLADEVYERLYYSGTIAPSFARLTANHDRLIVTNSFSKTYNMTGWRLGWAQSSERTIKTIYKAVEFMTSNPTAMVQQAGIAALRDGEAYIAELRAHYLSRRDQVARAFEALPGVTLPEPDGSFFAFPRVNHITDSSAFTAALVRETGVALAPGVAFGRDGEGYIRVCFASTADTLREALARIEKFVMNQRS